MATFELRISTPRGFRSLRIHANDEETARRLASRHGSVSRSRRRMSFDFLPGMTKGERAIWLYRMSKMLSARVTLTDALQTMIDNFGGEIRKASRKMLKRIATGSTIVEAIEQDPRNFPRTTAALVKAGMISGDSGKALQAVADYEKKLSAIKKGSTAAIWQAIGAFFAAYGMLYYSTNYLTPQVLNNVLFRRPGVENFDWTLTLGTVTMHAMEVVLVTVSALALLATVGRRTSARISDAIILKIPFYKDLVLAKANQLVLYRLGLLVGQGVPITDSLKLCLDDIGPGAMRDDIERAHAAMRKGTPWSKEMRTLHPTDKAALATSWDREDVARTLHGLSEQYGDIYALRLDVIGPILKTIAVVFLFSAGAIAFMQTMLPIMALMNAIQK